MESSFVDYRDQTGEESESDAEIIDDSLLVDESFTAKKKSVVKNHTVFIAESEESVTGDETEEGNIQKTSKSVIRRSNALHSNIILSSDDDTNKRNTTKRLSEKLPSKIVISSDEEEMSPEMVPKRRQIEAAARLSESFIGRKTKKRMMILDSDTDNSFIIQQERRGKLACLKDTPIKIDANKLKANNDANISIEENSDNNNDEDETNNSTCDQHADVSDPSNSESEHGDNIYKGNDLDKRGLKNERPISSGERSKTESSCGSLEVNNHSELHNEDDNDEFDEDQMVLSRATRMSIMGFIPKENESDDSDYIQSDDTKHESRDSLTNSVSESPETSATKMPEKEKTPEKLADTSRLSCSPFASPLQDITNGINNSARKSLNLSRERCKSDDSISLIEGRGLQIKSPLKLFYPKSMYTEKVIDDDVTIIDRSPEIIALSSDDEDVVTIEKKSPSMKKAKVKSEESEPRLDGNIKQYLVPASYPNQVVYVKKHVRENELSKLNGLKEELQNIRYLLDHMEMETLPDGGVKLIERLSALEGEVRRQGDKVATMVVEPDQPTPEDIAKDGFSKADKTPTWEDIQKASNAVQPRMFGKHAMATHLAERNLIMERLRDLHESLASRPPEHEQAAAPRAVRTRLMPHQLHALAWLRWRETQRPPGGILADDMGLGKTVTMISLVALDKEGGIDNQDDNDRYTSKSKAVNGGTLVVCPASLMQQWAGEVRTHCTPHALSVALHHGAARAQHAHRLAASDLVLTTYNILQRETEKGGVLTKVRWRRVILDEAHAVRNHKSATSGAVSALAARRRWALTGTPLHNKDLDLFALLKFLRCTPFDDLTMWKKWIDNKSMGGEERLSMIMRCLMLRRTKALLQAAGQLACLPARTQHDRRVTLSTDEMNVYQKVLVSSKTLFAQYLHQRAEKHADANGLTSIEKDNAYALHKKMAALQGVKPVKSHEILVLLLRLRQMCCHCGLIAAMLNEDDVDVEEDPAGRDLLAELNKMSLEDSRSVRKSGGRGLEDDNEESGGEGEGTTVAEAIRSVLSLKNPVFRLERPSAKIAAVMDCLNTKVFPNKGEKAVVVSQWTSVLRLVERELREARVRCVTLCGTVPVTARPALVDALNDARSDVRVMLLSLCAGGVGLNLCGANHLLLLDPHWNPQLEQQAQDRVYRVGQTRPVHIYRFMCVDTVEQSIRTLQQAKLELAENILTGARNTNASKLTIDDLKMLFNMGPADAHS